MSNQAGFYAVLPANVRRDKSLSPGTRLIFAEITAMCIDKPYCWPSNKYLGELYDVDERTVRRCLASLADRGYIRIEMQGDRRYILLGVDRNGIQTPVNWPDGRTELSGGEDSNVREGGQECPATPGQECPPEDTNREDTNRIPPHNPPRGESVLFPDMSVNPEVEEEFETFWANWPKKEKKDRARVAWKKARKRKDFPGLTRVLDIIALWKKTDRWRRGVIPHAATWLNDGRWNDEIPIEESEEERISRLMAESTPEGGGYGT